MDKKKTQNSQNYLAIGKSSRDLFTLTDCKTYQNALKSYDNVIGLRIDTLINETE